jgi:hypothetical protein
MIGQIVFIGTPHFGSPAIAGYLKNHLWGWELLALLARHLSRDTFRSLWGVLSLLPAPSGVYPGTRASDPLPWRSSVAGDAYIHPCGNFDFYDATSWELGLSKQATDRLQLALDAAARCHQELYNGHCALPQDLRDRMCQISGVGYRTLFRTAYKPSHAWEFSGTIWIVKRRACQVMRTGRAMGVFPLPRPTSTTLANAAMCEVFTVIWRRFNPSTKMLSDG